MFLSHKKKSLRLIALVELDPFGNSKLLSTAPLGIELYKGDSSVKDKLTPVLVVWESGARNLLGVLDSCTDRQIKIKSLIV